MLADARRVGCLGGGGASVGRGGEGGERERLFKVWVQA